jgi:hypothetical protein
MGSARLSVGIGKIAVFPIIADLRQCFLDFWPYYFLSLIAPMDLLRPVLLKKRDDRLLKKRQASCTDPLGLGLKRAATRPGSADLSDAGMDKERVGKVRAMDRSHDQP